jgi:hypothetical protein
MPLEFAPTGWTSVERQGRGLMMQGCDSRAQAFYGMDPERASHSVLLGSCTSNPLTRTACEWAGRLDPTRLDMHDVQDQVARLFGAERAILCASGTDLEALASLCLGERRFFTLAIDRHEVGSGCMAAAQGLPHAPGGAILAPLALDVTLTELPLRDTEGSALPPEEVDLAFLALARQAHRRPAILRLCACSKTGLQGPSETAMAHALTENPNARCLVDACQGRFTRAEVQAWLKRGWAVMVTGSKRHGAPPFCAALLLGAGHDTLWPQHRQARLGQPGPGLAARWLLALEHVTRAGGTWWMEAGEVDEWQACCATFLTALPQGLVTRSAQRQGILSLDMGWDMATSRQFWAALAARGFFVGQPVSTGRTAHLRLASSLATDRPRLPDMLARLAGVWRELASTMQSNFDKQA